MPIGRLAALFLRNRKDDFVLHRIRVLKFIDQHGSIIPFNSFTDGRMFEEERPCPCQQPIKRKPALPGKGFANVPHQRKEQGQEIVQECMVDRQKLLRRPDERSGLFEIVLLPFTHSVSEILVEPFSFCGRQVLPARQPFFSHEPHQRRRRSEHVLDFTALRPIIRFHELIRPVFHVLNPA